jgi:hypothetical protein
MPDQAEPQPGDEVGGTDEAHRETARWLEHDNPGWIVVFGVYTRQFVAFPRFPAPPRTIVATAYPAALPGRMRKVESRLNAARPQREDSRSPDG